MVRNVSFQSLAGILPQLLEWVVLIDEPRREFPIPSGNSSSASGIVCSSLFLW